MSDPVLSVSGLAKSYAGRAALHEATLDVRAGEFVAVLGPSGSGKTTLFRCLTRLVEPDAGTITLDGCAMRDLQGPALADARRRIGVIFQQFNLVRRLSALDNVLAGRLATAPLWRVLLRSFDADAERRAAEALAAVGLLEQMHQRADTLSGGQQQRVAIARALAQESLIVLADEPVASLDPDAAEQVLALLHGLTRSRGLAVMCTLHQPHLAARFADRVLRMQAGRIVAEDVARPRALNP